MEKKKRLIYTDALMDDFRRYMAERFDRERCASEENCKTCVRMCLWRKVVNAAPTVDAVEVVHGSWIEDGYYGNPFVCSHCGSEGCYSGDFKNKQYYYTNYCPHCGAKMDGESE
jgi:hypothetical protein